MTTPLNRLLDLHRRGTRLGLALALAAASLLVPHAVRALDTTPDTTTPGVYAAGDNENGELGNGTTTDTLTTTPVAVSNANGFTNTGVTAVAGGAFHSLAVQKGAVYAWGNNADGQLGTGTTNESDVPVPVNILTSGVTAVAAGSVHSLALVNGQVYAWGNNSSGQLGTGDTNSSSVPKAITVGNAGNQVVAITATERGSFAVDASGNLYMWGIYIDEEDSSTPILTPQIISAPPQGFAYTLASANSQGDHVVALLSATVPVITSAASSTATLGTPYSYQIAASGSPTSYAADNLPQGLSVDTTTGLISGTVTSPKAVNTYEVPLAATNANGQSAPFALILTVALPADPVITSANTASGTVGTAFSYTITATGTMPFAYDAENLPPGLSVDSATGIISGTPTAAGTTVVSLSVSDPYDDLTQADLTITIALPPMPVVTSANTVNGTVGQFLSYQITATNSPTSYGATNLPGGLSIDTASGLISGTPTVAGTFTVTLMATNAGGTRTQDVNIFIAPPAPVFTSAASVNALTNQAFVYQLTASNNPDGFQVGEILPPGLNFDANTATLFGTPTTPGTYTVPLFAFNKGGQGMATLTIIVSDAPVPTPVITSALSASTQAGSVFAYQITASNGPTSFDATNLPDGLKVDATSGIVSGTPTAVGTFNFTVSATNPSGVGMANVVLVVTAAPVVPVQPQITSAASASVVAGQPFTYLITASGNPTAFAATGLPAGLTLDPATGLITGTPTATGSFPVSLSATGAGGTGTATLTLTVAAVLVTTPTITSPASASAQVGQVFSYQIAASNNATGYAVTGLPDGLTLNAVSGLITGTPTTAGTFTLALSATNSAGAGTASVSLTVTTAQVLVPVVNSAASASGQVGVAFSYQITASNAALVYGASGLPAGLSLDDTTGILSGQPTAAGTFTVTLMATNSAGTGTASLTLTIAAQPLPVVTVIASVPKVVLGTGQSATFAITRTGGDSSQALTVSYRVSGMGINGTDFVMLKGTKTFKPGQLTRRVDVTPEGMLEGAAKKKVKLTVVAGDGYVLGTPVTAKVHILAENP